MWGMDDQIVEETMVEEVDGDVQIGRVVQGYQDGQYQIGREGIGKDERSGRVLQEDVWR